MRFLRLLLALSLVFVLAAACSAKGTVTKAELVNQDTCEITVELDDREPDGSRVSVVEKKRPLDCQRCPEGSRYPDCLNRDVGANQIKKENDMTVWVCDWTEWQGIPCPARRVADEGYGMVKLKVGGATMDRDGIRDHWAYLDPLFVSSALQVSMVSGLIPAVFWYLVPGNPRAQAGRFLDMVDYVGWLDKAALYLDVEEDNLAREHVADFSNAVWGMAHRRLVIYTRRSYWVPRFGDDTFGYAMGQWLEDARWVPESVREDPTKPYASQQAKAIDPTWWDRSYAGWPGPTLIQFSDHVKVADRWTSASIYRGSKETLRRELTL